MNHADYRVCFVLFIGLSLTMSASALSAQAQKKACKCRAPGGIMRDLGTVECVDIAGREKLVFCTMSTNTPYWKDVEGGVGCPSA